MQAEMQTIKKRVMQLLDWDAQDYADHQYKCGCKYLQAYIPRDPQGIDMLIASKTFWGWWRSQWHARDLEFIDAAVMISSHKNRLALYLSTHSPSELAQEIRPNAIVLGESYAQMIGHLHDNKI
jgi:hypothetical protein